MSGKPTEFSAPGMRSSRREGSAVSGASRGSRGRNSRAPGDRGTSSRPGPVEGGNGGEPGSSAPPPPRDGLPSGMLDGMEREGSARSQRSVTERITAVAASKKNRFRALAKAASGLGKAAKAKKGATEGATSEHNGNGSVNGDSAKGGKDTNGVVGETEKPEVQILPRPPRRLKPDEERPNIIASRCLWDVVETVIKDLIPETEEEKDARYAKSIRLTMKVGDKVLEKAAKLGHVPDATLPPGYDEG